MIKIALTEDGKLECVHFGLPKCLIGGVAGKGDVSAHLWHGEGQLAVRVPTSRARRFISGGSLGPRLSVHHPGDHRRRIAVLGKAMESNVVPYTCLPGASYSHVLRRNCKGKKSNDEE